jgi:hypothetical protein
VSVEHEIEEAVRAYFEAGTEPEESTGPIGELFELTRDFEDPVIGVGRRFKERKLEVMRIEGDRAEVAIDATLSLTYESGDAGQRRDRVLIEGPLLLRRSEGAWRVADYSRNGRRRSEAIRLRPMGAQEVDGLKVSALAADLQSDYTLIYLEVTNSRAVEASVEWSALGVPRKGSWRYLSFELTRKTFPPGRTVVAGWMWKGLPADLPVVRLIISGRRTTFDFIVDVSGGHQLAALQPAPSSLPLRLRVQRSRLFQLLPLLTVVPVFLIGGWPAVGIVMAVIGALIVASIARLRWRGGRLPNRRPAVAGTGLLLAGLALFVATGLEFAGCPPRSEATSVSDEFVQTLLTRGPFEVDRFLSPYANPVVNQVPGLRTMSDRRAARVVRTRSDKTVSECFPLTAVLPGAGQEPCFVYQLPGRRLAVFMECDFDEWKVASVL